MRHGREHENSHGILKEEASKAGLPDDANENSGMGSYLQERPRCGDNSGGPRCENEPSTMGEEEPVDSCFNHDEEI